MPELPEVETVRRTLAQRIVDRRVASVRVRRRDVVRGPTTLLRGQRIAEVQRVGKQLALVGQGGDCVCVHLGMSGSLCVYGAVGDKRDTDPQVPKPGGGKVVRKTDHVHVRWTLDGGVSVDFRDPRRFGGVWAFPSVSDLWGQRWGKLGPDALVITPSQLRAGLSRTKRALKAALLDQQLVAGLGNIYVDELLFSVGLHPLETAKGVTKAQCDQLVRAMRRLLGRAIDAGGTTLRDYVDASGQAGGFQTRHRVYGRAGEPCGACGRVLSTLVVAGRTTTACETCQPVGSVAKGSRE